MERFGSIIKRARLRKGWTLEALAKRCRTHKGYISGLENHRVNPPSARMTLVLSKALRLNFRTMAVLGYLEKRPKCIRTSDIAIWLAEEGLSARKNQRVPDPTVASNLPEDWSKVNITV